MKHRALAFVAGLLLTGVIAAPTLANTTAVDQKMEVTATNFMGAATFAQTFTSGYSAPLTGVDLYLWNSVSTVVTVTIRPLDPVTQYPTNTIYSTGTATVKAEGWYHFNTPVDISNGAHYAIVFTMTGASTGTHGATTGQYSRGSALVKNTNWGPYYNANTDFSFRTWVSLNLQTTHAPTLPPPVIKTPTPTPPPTATPTPTATPEPTASPTATEVTPSPTAEPSASPAPADNSGGDGSGPMIAIVVILVALLGIAGGAGGALLIMRRKGRTP
jgi:hypothetical protein